MSNNQRVSSGNLTYGKTPFIIGSMNEMANFRYVKVPESIWM